MVTVIANSMQEHVQAWRHRLRSLTPFVLHKLSYAIRSVLLSYVRRSYQLQSLLPWLILRQSLLLYRYYSSHSNSLAVRRTRHALQPDQGFVVVNYFPRLPLPCQLPLPITSISLLRSCPSHQLHRYLALAEVEPAAHSVAIKRHRQTLNSSHPLGRYQLKRKLLRYHCKCLR